MIYGIFACSKSRVMNVVGAIISVVGCFTVNEYFLMLPLDFQVDNSTVAISSPLLASNRG